MYIGEISGAQALQAFLAEKTNANNLSDSRLYIENNELKFGADLGCMTLFAAKLGFGNAAMSNVSKFIKTNKATYLKDDQAYTDYNTFISAYNDKQCLCWKKAKKVKNAVVQVFQEDPNKAFDYGSREGMLQLVNHHLENCKTLLNSSNFEKKFADFADACQMLNYTLDTWELKDPITKEEKQAINEILNFKNAARSTIFPAKGNQPLKGDGHVYNPLNSVKKEDKDALKTTLSEIRTNVLKKYFRERLELDGGKLAQLVQRFKENEGTLPEADFLRDQLARWQKKIDHGKPIAIPKWYHCTKTLNVLTNILDTHLLYASGCFPGVFVSNRPEVNGVGGYGDYCLTISEHIEKVGTKEPGKPGILGKAKQTVYPKYSQMNQSHQYPIHYSDIPLAPQDNVLQNNQDQIGIWFGFQRGAHTLAHNPTLGMRIGTEGVPLERIERIKNGSLKYYKDTTLCYIFKIYDEPSLNTMAEKRRVQVVSYKQAEAMRTLINGTFHCTLPASWQGNLQSF